MRISAVILPCVLLASACGGPEAGSQSAELAAGPSARAGTLAPVAALPDRKADSPSISTELRPPNFSVVALLNTTLSNGIHTSEVVVQVHDEAGQPAANVEVFGSFTGSIEKDVVLKSGADGIASVAMTSDKQHIMVGFTVNSVTYQRGDRRASGWVTSDVINMRPCCQGQMPPQK